MCQQATSAAISLADAVPGKQRLAAADSKLDLEEHVELLQRDFASTGERYSEWLAHVLIAVDVRFTPLEGGVVLYPLNRPDDIDPGVVCGGGGGGFLAPRAFGGGDSDLLGGAVGGGSCSTDAIATANHAHPVPGVPLAVDVSSVAPYRAALAADARDVLAESAKYFHALTATSAGCVTSVERLTLPDTRYAS